MPKLESFEAMLHEDEREYIVKIKHLRRLVSNAEALRQIIREHRNHTGTLPEQPCVTDKVQ